MMKSKPRNELLLNIKDLKISYEIDGHMGKAVDGISFGLRKGECFGLVGESGSGKTTVAKSILHLLPSNGKVIGGNVFLKDKDILSFSEEEMDRIRWKEISLVTQSAMNALDPVSRISDQMITTFMAHPSKSLTKQDILKESQKLFELVGLNKDRIFDYPHQFSGGMRQRVIIAMAIALNADLIIADEPTTALDVIMQAQIINLLKSLAAEKGISLILITHDISIVAEICHKVGVMYAGRLMETGSIGRVFNTPYHPYTMGLKGAFPTIRELKKSLISIPGSPPLLTERSEGCGFAERCPFSVDICMNKTPRVLEIHSDHSAACHRINDAKKLRKEIVKIFGTQTKGSNSL